MTRRKFFFDIATGLMLPVAAAKANPYFNLIASSVETAVPGCVTGDTAQDSSGTNFQIGSAASNVYRGTKYTPSVTATVCKIELTLRKVNNPTGNLTAYVYDHNAGANTPGTLLATSTNVIDSSTLSTSYTQAVFNFTGVALTNGTVYWVVISKVGSSAVNNVTWEGQSTGGREIVSTDGSTWGSASAGKIDVQMYH